MDPNKIPFNSLIVGPANSGKSRFVVDQIYGPFRGNFDYIVLICPTFAHNKTYHRIGEDPVFDDYAGELSQDEYKGLISKLKERKFSYLVFTLRHPYGVKSF